MTQKSYSTRFLVNSDHPNLEGHFPGMPVFPAVSQIELVVDLLERELQRPIKTRVVKRAKFKAILRPGTEVEISVNVVGNAEAHWTIKDENRVYSAGSIAF